MKIRFGGRRTLLAIAALLLTALAGGAVLLPRPGAQASPDATITVNSTADTNTRDGWMTLREALLLANGDLAVGDLLEEECAQVSNSTYGPPCSTTDTIGAGSADTIVFDTNVFPPAAPATVTLSSGLPSLSTGDDTLDGSSAGVIVDGVNEAVECLYVSSDRNFVRGLEIYNCSWGVVISGEANTIGGRNASERNVISGHAWDAMVVLGSNNRVIGNYVGTNATGDAALAIGDFGVALGGQDNIIGGAGQGERNVISGSSTNVEVFGTGNKVIGNYIGTNATGDAPLALAYQDTGVWLTEGENISIGGANPGEGNVISGHTFNGLRLEGDGHSIRIIGNYIGTNAAGDAGLGNQGYGVDINGGYNYTIGGTSAGERNVISGNEGAGFRFAWDSASGNRVIGNYIGTNPTGDGAVPNGEGITIWQGENNTIGGGSAGERNVISGNNNDGVDIWASGNSVVGNYIGTNAAGDAALPNLSGVAVLEGQDNIIGGSNQGERNVISGNNVVGVLVGGTGNKVIGNYIGTNVTGTAALGGNYDGGVYLSYASNSTIGGTATGQGNVIAYNAGDGVYVIGTATTGNTIRGNSIHSNGGKGIENINGGNMELGPPVIDSVGSASGHTDPKCYPCTVEVFSDDEDEGRIYHGSTSTNDDATGTWTYPGGVTGPNITATITDAAGNTSEFSLYDRDGDGVGNGYPEPIDNCPDDYNPDQTNTDAYLEDAGASVVGDSLGDACDDDDDNDDWADSCEIYLGTEPLDNCACGLGPGGDAWPLDLNMDCHLNVVTDVLNFRGRIGAKPGDPNWLQRLDFNADGLISVVGDVLMYRGRIGETCT